MFGLPWLTGKFIVYGFLILSLMGMIGTGVYKVKQWGANEVRAEWTAATEKQRKAEQEKALIAANNRESDSAKAKVTYRTIKEQVAVYIDRPVYHTNCIDADGLRDINSALRGEITNKPGVTSGVPKAVAP